MILMQRTMLSLHVFLIERYIKYDTYVTRPKMIIMELIQQFSSSSIAELSLRASNSEALHVGRGAVINVSFRFILRALRKEKR